MTFVRDDQVERALSYLQDNAAAAAKARASRLYMEDWCKILKAQLMREYERGGVNAIGAQEREAMADDRYAKHLQAVEAAIEEDERHRFLRESAMATIDAWRSQAATERAMRI